MTTLSQVKSHQSLPRLQKPCVNSKIGGTTRVRLNIHTPFFGLQSVRDECSIPREILNLVDKLIASVISGTWVSLTVLICEAATQRFKNKLVSEVLRGN